MGIAHYANSINRVIERGVRVPMNGQSWFLFCHQGLSSFPGMKKGIGTAAFIRSGDGSAEREMVGDQNVG